MKSQILARVLLLLFCLTHTGVVVGSHTCLKSNQTDFSLFPSSHSGGCCESKSSPTAGNVLECSETLNPGSKTSGCCSLPLNSEPQPTACCASTQCAVDAAKVNGSAEQNAQPQAKGLDCSFFNSSEGISVCAAESCCRVSQVALLDLHLRTLPEKRATPTVALSLPTGIQFVFPGFYAAAKINVGLLEKVLSLPSVRTASLLQVWRL